MFTYLLTYLLVSPTHRTVADDRQHLFANKAIQNIKIVLSVSLSH